MRFSDVYKRQNFVLRSANALLGTAFDEIQGIGTLPLGSSFYTFQTLSYSIDVYRRDVKAAVSYTHLCAAPNISSAISVKRIFLLLLPVLGPNAPSARRK